MLKLFSSKGLLANKSIGFVKNAKTRRIKMKPIFPFLLATILFFNACSGQNDGSENSHLALLGVSNKLLLDLTNPPKDQKLQTILPNVYYVDSELGSDTNPGTYAQAFRTITKAVSVTVAGDTIYVAPGVYSKKQGEIFPILIPNQVQLYGNESGKGIWAEVNSGYFGSTYHEGSTFIKGGGNLSGTGIYPALIAGNGSKIAGFFISNPVLSSGTSVTAIYLPNLDSWISDNTLAETWSGFGILISSGNRYTYNIILRNNIMDNIFGIIESDSKGESWIQENRIYRNQIGIATNDNALNLGDGSAGSGLNSFSCNTQYDLYTQPSLASILRAKNNKWDHVPATIQTSYGIPADILNVNSLSTIQMNGAVLAENICNE